MGAKEDLGQGGCTARAKAVMVPPPPPFNFVNNSMSVIDYPFSSEAAVAKWALWESVFNVLSAHCLRYEACWHRVVPGVCCCLCC